MTVCVAALCTDGTTSIVIAASDRMLTFGDVEYEPSKTKIWVLDEKSQIIALVSGEMAQQSVIASRATKRIRAQEDMTVDEAADIYAEEFGTFRSQKNERTFLKPLGLTMKTLLSPGAVDPQLARDLMAAMQRADLDDEVIVAGVDPDGSKHIYVISDPGKPILMDTPGWAAIGSGRNHVDSEFTVERYHSSWNFEQALLLLYTAKKRAEAAPGVGATTDVSVILDAGFDFMRESVVTAVEGVNAELVVAERDVRSSMMQRMNEIVSAAIDQPRAEEAPRIGPPSEEPPTPGTEGDTTNP